MVHEAARIANAAVLAIAREIAIVQAQRLAQGARVLEVFAAQQTIRANDCTAMILPRGAAFVSGSAIMPPMETPLPRNAFDLDPDVLWVMHCSEGPVPVAASDAVTRFLRVERRPWEVGWEEHFIGIPAALRTESARLIGGDEADITLTATTSSGILVVAQGYPWKPGDEVITPLGEFPTNAWPWLGLKSRGVSLREVPLWNGHIGGARAWDSAPPPPDVNPEDRLLDAIGPSTVAVSVSWVRFQDGLRLDLARLAEGCRERDVRLFVDGIQGAGTLPLDLSAIDGVDAFVSGGHKGLLAPQGLGFLWTSPGFRVDIAPLGSWLSVEDCTDFSRPSTDLDRGWLPDGRRFEQGVPNLVGAVALLESLRLINHGDGAAAIAEHVRGLQERLLDGLRRNGTAATDVERLGGLLEQRRLGAILGFHHEGRGEDWAGACLRSGTKNGILASVREGYLRIALHGWHDEDDVDRLVPWLNEILTSAQAEA